MHLVYRLSTGNRYMALREGGLNCLHSIRARWKAGGPILRNTGENMPTGGSCSPRQSKLLPNAAVAAIPPFPRTKLQLYWHP